MLVIGAGQPVTWKDKVDLDRTNNTFVHALWPLLYIVALNEGIDPKQLGLSIEKRAPMFTA